MGNGLKAIGYLALLAEYVPYGELVEIVKLDMPLSEFFDFAELILENAAGVVGGIGAGLANNSEILVREFGGIYKIQSRFSKFANIGKVGGVVGTILGTGATVYETYLLWKNGDLTTTQKALGTAVNVGGFAAGYGVGAVAPMVMSSSIAPPVAEATLTTIFAPMLWNTNR